MQEVLNLVLPIRTLLSGFEISRILCTRLFNAAETLFIPEVNAGITRGRNPSQSSSSEVSCAIQSLCNKAQESNHEQKLLSVENLGAISGTR